MSVVFAFRPDAGQPAVPPSPGVFMPGRNRQGVILIHGLTGTPAEVGTPWVSRPEPALTSSESEWPW